MNGYAQSLQSNHNSDVKPENLSSSSDGQVSRHGLGQDSMDVKPNVFNLKNEFNHNMIHHSKQEYQSGEYENHNYDDRDHSNQNCDDIKRNIDNARKAADDVIDMVDEEEDDMEEAENLSLNNNGSNNDHLDKIN